MRINFSRSLVLSAGAAAVILIAPNLGAQDQLTLPVQRPGALPALVASDRVQEELNLTAKQKSTVHSLRARHRDAVQKVVKGTDATSDASKQAAHRSIQSINAKYNSQVLGVLTPVQQNRLTQIERQLLGGHMLLSADVREKLGLSNEQKADLARIHRDHQAQVSVINAWFEDGEVSNYERVLYQRDERQKQASRMQRVLSREQRSEFDAMAGEPLKFFSTL